MPAMSDSDDRFQPAAGRYDYRAAVCAVFARPHPLGYNRYKPTTGKQPSR
jgi:hypothetical protein